MAVIKRLGITHSPTPRGAWTFRLGNNEVRSVCCSRQCQTSLHNAIARLAGHQEQEKVHAVCAVTARTPLSFCPQRSFGERGRCREQATECSPSGTEDAAADTSPAAADCLAQVYFGCFRGRLTASRSCMPQPSQREGVPRHRKVEERGADSQCLPLVHPPASILHSCSQSLSLCMPVHSPMPFF